MSKFKRRTDLLTGAKGDQGPEGPSGKQGFPGTRGAPGADGPKGAQGPRGLPGKDGVDGKDGTDGAQGKQGLTGTRGAPGADGADGKAGPAGPKGDQGERGDAGLDGKQGFAGTRGIPGQDGVDGTNGLHGTDGQDGEKGDTGEDGPQGKAGAKGDKGDKGDAGPQGEQGEEGERGPQGFGGGGGWAVGFPNGDGSPRDRGIAMLDSDIAANTTVSTSTNATGTLLDYSGVTFADDVELHINGVLMRCGATSGANYDVYPAGTAASGDFACEFNLKQGDVIQQFIGGGNVSAARSTTIYYGGLVKADGTTSAWYGHPNTTVWYHTTQVTLKGSVTDANPQIWDVGWVAPYDGKITEVQLWIRPADANVAGDFALVKTTFTSGTSTRVNGRLGTLMNFAGGGSPNNSYDISTTFSSSNTVTKGDAVNWAYRNSDATGGATIYFRLTASFEEVV